MQTIVSDRITILPILNKSKKIILDTYLNNLLIAKNRISTQSIIDSSFQDLLFSNDLLTECNKQFIACKKKLLNYYVNFPNPIFTGWELQKFINSDLIGESIDVKLCAISSAEIRIAPKDSNILETTDFPLPIVPVIPNTNRFDHSFIWNYPLLISVQRQNMN